MTVSRAMAAGLGLVLCWALGLAAAPARASQLRASWSAAVVAVPFGPHSSPLTTFRSVLRTTLPGSAVRVRFSNRWDAPLHVEAAAIGVRAGTDGAAIAPGSWRSLTFAGSRSVDIPRRASTATATPPL